VDILNLLFPKTCLNCKKSGGYVCSDCIQKVRKVKPTCAYCEKASIDGLTHAKCKRKFGLDGLISVWKYQGVVRKALLGLKYKFATAITEELTGYVARNIKENDFAFPKDLVLIPVPLHRFRKNWRGFNQVEEVGKLLCEKMGWNYDGDLLIRSKYKTPQTELKGKQRKTNVLGVFSLKTKNRKLKTLRVGDSPESETENRQLILFDDVYTTGSTIKEAAKVLKRNGVKKVWGLTIAG
jgi:ComF family protein